MLVISLPFSLPFTPLVKDPFLTLGSSDESPAKVGKEYSEFVLCSLAQPGRRCVLKSLLGFPAIPVHLIKDNITAAYKVSPLSLYPNTATTLPASGRDFCFFIYNMLVTEELPQGLNTL